MADSVPVPMLPVTGYVSGVPVVATFKATGDVTVGGALSVTGSTTFSSAVTSNGTLLANGNGIYAQAIQSTSNQVKIQCQATNSALYAVIIAQGTNGAASGTSAGLAILPTYNQTAGTGANTDLLINRIQTAVGSGTQRLASMQVGGSEKWGVDNNAIQTIASTATTPPTPASGFVAFWFDGTSVKFKFPNGNTASLTA